MTKIDIVSGFLGAGKTTLIKKLLSEAFVGEKVVLIENEFGEIGIDGGFLKEAGIEIREMNSGCICCSLVGDFGEALKEVIETYHPDRILIEPSGVGKLSDVIKAVKGVKEKVDITLNSYTAIVDVKKCRMYMRNFGEFYDNQIENAGAVILSRTDIASEEQIAQCVDMVREKNAAAPIITTPIEELDGKKILEAMEHGKSLEEELLEAQRHSHSHHGEKCGCGHGHHHEEECGSGHEHHHEEECGCGHGHHHGEECGCGHEHHHEHSHGHHHADEVFTSWGKETITAYTKEEISDILHTLEEENTYGTILRAKGMVQGKEGAWIYFDMVPGEHEVREGAPEYTGRICVIGSDIKEEKLAELFRL